VSAVSQFLVGDVDVIVEGSGPQSIVMIHGWPDTHRLWDRQVEALRADYRCIRFTLPGFDRHRPSRAYSLHEVVDAVHRIVEQACPGERVTLLLHDWGCLFGYQFALRQPQLVARIVGVDVGDAGSRRHLRALGAKGKAMIASYQLWLAAAWRIGGRVGDAMSRKMAGALGCPTDPASIKAQMAYPYYVVWAGARGGFRDAAPFLPGCPMLYVYGRRKPVMFHSPGWAEEVAARPFSRVIGFDAGHWLMITKPAQFNEALRAWLSATRAAGSQ
jgi:pimeloyl-ACP methyl ester carboxylesterase